MYVKLGYNGTYADKRIYCMLWGVLAFSFMYIALANVEENVFNIVVASREALFGYTDIY